MTSLMPGPNLVVKGFFDFPVSYKVFVKCTSSENRDQKEHLHSVKRQCRYTLTHSELVEPEIR